MEDQLSNHVCEFCHSELLRFSVFKKDLIEKQVKLYKMLKYHNQKAEEKFAFESKIETVEDDDNNNIDEDYDEIDRMKSVSEYGSSDESSEGEEEEESCFEESHSQSEISQEEEEDDENSSHSEYDPNIRKFSCDICNSKLKTKAGLNNHVRAHLMNKEGDFKCSKCDYSTFSPSRLAAHLKHSHPGISNEKGKNNVNVIEKLQKIDSSPKELKTTKDDTKSENSSLPYKYKCFCELPFKDLNSLKVHQNKIHGVLKKCNYGCDKSYDTFGYWIRHIRKHHPAHENDCLKMVTAAKENKWYTEIEERNPFNEDLICQICDYIATEKGDLVNHYQIKHSEYENERKKTECPKCLKLFVSPKTMKIHLKSSHGSVKRYEIIDEILSKLY